MIDCIVDALSSQLGNENYNGVTSTPSFSSPSSSSSHAQTAAASSAAPSPSYNTITGRSASSTTRAKSSRNPSSPASCGRISPMSPLPSSESAPPAFSPTPIPPPVVTAWRVVGPACLNDSPPSTRRCRRERAARLKE
ncbi:hypothetical protein B0J12DRAFT_697052 [Macrophomina phaseolina]|uniref:Uncharacterized protein n=1 Tax=Macrophomina phaseolina TaxID=35725 RepID=A0ABQ8GIS1_9PEZI|nr:hypothetical protein B0J12DRAFT_697052 [Macrophomina phaseolina]